VQRPIAKADPELRLWCLVQEGYTDLEINAASSKRAWLEARTLADSLGDQQWEARAEGELGQTRGLLFDGLVEALLIQLDG